MKKIYFDDLRNDRKSSKIILFSILFALLSILILFLLSIRQNTDSLLIALYCIVSAVSRQGRKLFLPRYISWNQKYINVRLDSWFSKRVRFKEVLEVTQSNRKIIFWKINQKQAEVDFSRYSEVDFVRFINIISKNLRSKAHFKEKPSWIQSQKLTS